MSDQRTELSTPNAFVYRWVIPAALTLIAIYSLWVFAIAGASDGLRVINIVVGFVNAAVLIFVARLFDRAKRVWIEGDHLVIYDYNQTARVPLANVMQVHQTLFFIPDRICIRFRQPTVFGSQVVFFPRYRGAAFPFPHPIVGKLERLIAD